MAPQKALISCFAILRKALSPAAPPSAESIFQAFVAQEFAAPRHLPLLSPPIGQQSILLKIVLMSRRLHDIHIQVALSEWAMEQALRAVALFGRMTFISSTISVCTVRKFTIPVYQIAMQVAPPPGSRTFRPGSSGTGIYCHADTLLSELCVAQLELRIGACLAAMLGGRFQQ